MNTPEIKSFIRENSVLFWYIPENKKEEISHELLVETIFNYGDMKAVLKLFDLLGINYVAELYKRSIAMSDRRKGNFHELTRNYFSLLLQRYAS
jgi:hypothetical protein